MAPVLVLQSHDDRPPGLLGAWAPARGVALDVIRVDRWRTLPEPAGYLFAVALGADASLAGSWPTWAESEIEWLSTADALGVPVLGIGFGAQALGVALGGAVRRVRTGGPAWINVESRDPARLPSGPWLLPRNDAISAPPDAEELACDESGPLAFAVGRHLGVHFHPEVTPALLARWSRQGRDRAAQERSALLRQAREYRELSALAAIALFDAFAARAGLATADAGRPVRSADPVPAPAPMHARRRLVFAPYTDAAT